MLTAIDVLLKADELIYYATSTLKIRRNRTRLSPTCTDFSTSNVLWMFTNVYISI